MPSAIAQSVVAQLKETGRVERGWLGVSMQPVDATMASALQMPDAKGALIGAVEPDSPAAKAGLQPGDVVVGFGGQAIAAPRDLAEAVGGLKPGAKSTIAVLRDGKRVEQPVTLGDTPNTREARKDGPDAAQGSTGLGLALAPRGRNGQGAVVAEVKPGSIAATQGLQPGDVILRAGGRPVARPGDVAEAVAAARRDGRPAIALQIERDSGRAFVALPLRAG